MGSEGADGLTRQPVERREEKRERRGRVNDAREREMETVLKRF